MLTNVDFQKAGVLCFLVISLAIVTKSQAADHVVTSNIQAVDCSTFNGGIQPGDSIILPAGERNGLKIINCKGTKENPITIRNDVVGNGPVILRRESAKDGEFVFQVRSSEYFVIDGTGGWQGSTGHCGWRKGKFGNNCGIKITRKIDGDSPSSFLKFTGSFRNYTVKGVHIDGRFWGQDALTVGNGAGIGVHQRSSETANMHPGYWQENITYENNYVHNTRGEGFYLGANHGTAPETPLRNIVIQNNYIDTVGRNGVTLKSAIGGRNFIRNNYVEKSGLERTPNGGRGGITAFETTHVAMHNNIVLDTFAWCYGAYTNLLPENYPLIEPGKHLSAVNNLGVRCGSVGEGDRGHGIYVGANSGASVIQDIVVDYNTIVNSGPTTAISVGSQISGDLLKMRNNIVATQNSTLYFSEKGLRQNNYTGTIESFKFLNPAEDNYRLRPESRAVSVGTAPHPDTDLDGVLRPVGNGPDVGAFESSMSESRPKPPELRVESF